VLVAVNRLLEGKYLSISRWIASLCGSWKIYHTCFPRSATFDSRHIPIQMKPRILLSMLLQIPSGSHMLCMTSWDSWEDYFAKVTLPAQLSNLLFQPCNLPWILSRMKEKSLFFTFPVSNGNPKYLPKLLVLWKLIIEVNFPILLLGIFFEARKIDLCILTFNPKAKQNWSRTSFNIFTWPHLASTDGI